MHEVEALSGVVLVCFELRHFLVLLKPIQELIRHIPKPILLLIIKMKLKIILILLPLQKTYPKTQPPLLLTLHIPRIGHIVEHILFAIKILGLDSKIIPFFCFP